MVGSVILLKEVLVTLPQLSTALMPAESTLLAAIGQNCACPVFDELLNEIFCVLDEVIFSVRHCLITVQEILVCRGVTVFGVC
jgi:hypothetical protein